MAFSGINYADTYIRKGAFPGLPTPPFTLGMEGSGIVELVGNDVKDFQVGELVAFAGNQTYAEYVIIDTQSTQSWEVAVPVTLQKDRAVQILLGHSKLDNTIRYLGVEREDALRLSEQTDC